MKKEEAIKTLNELLRETNDPWYEEVYNMAIEALSAEPKTGKWTEIENGEYLCSNCSRITIGYPPSNCPHCRAKMQGDDSE